MGNLAKDTTEIDLWAFDDIEAEEGSEALSPPPRTADSILPVPRDADKIKARQPKEPAPAKADGKLDRIKVNVGKPQMRAQSGSVAGMAKPGNDFDDLDHWDEPEALAAEIEELPEIEPPPVTPAEPAAREKIAPIAETQDEFSPVIAENSTPVSLRPRLNLTAIERVGLVALAVMLLVGGVAIFLGTISRLPTGDLAKANDFPIQGKQFQIQSADTYWRAPKSDDPVRRDTQLIPVLAMDSSGGPAAIRVFFRNGDGEFVGDAVTRTLKSGGKFEIAATAGFDDVGMHAAYRAGQSKPWTIEILEAPSENSPATEFKKLFELHVSPDRR